MDCHTTPSIARRPYQLIGSKHGQGEARPRLKLWLRTLAYWPLTSCLFLGIGCLHHSTSSEGMMNGQAALTKDITDEKDLPKRAPQASTCVALGNLQLKAATEENRSQAQKDQCLDLARKYFQQALKIDSKCTEAYRGLGQTYQALGDYERTLATYQNGLKVHPKEGIMWYELGMAQARQKDWSPALKSLQAATSLDPENRSYNNMYAHCLGRTGHYDESYAIFKKIVGEAQAHYNLARMLHHNNDLEASKRQLYLALQANPSLPGAAQLLSQLQTPPPAKISPIAPASFEVIDVTPSNKTGT